MGDGYDDWGIPVDLDEEPAPRRGPPSWVVVRRPAKVGALTNTDEASTAISIGGMSLSIERVILILVVLWFVWSFVQRAGKMERKLAKLTRYLAPPKQIVDVKSK